MSLSHHVSSPLDLPDELLCSICLECTESPYPDPEQRSPSYSAAQRSSSQAVYLSRICFRFLEPGRKALYQHLSPSREQWPKLASALKEFPQVFREICSRHVRILHIRDYVQGPEWAAGLIRDCENLRVLEYQLPGHVDVASTGEAIATHPHLRHLGIWLAFSTSKKTFPLFIDSLAGRPFQTISLHSLVDGEATEITSLLRANSLVFCNCNVEVPSGISALIQSWSQQVPEQERMSLAFEGGLFSLDSLNSALDALASPPSRLSRLDIVLDDVLQDLRAFPVLSRLTDLKTLRISILRPRRTELFELPNSLVNLYLTINPVGHKAELANFHHPLGSVHSWLCSQLQPSQTLTDFDTRDPGPNPSCCLQHLNIKFTNNNVVDFFGMDPGDGIMRLDWDSALVAARDLDKTCEKRGIVTSPRSFWKMVRDWGKTKWDWVAIEVV